MKKLLIAAPKSGSGKTVLTCGLLEALGRRGALAASFKCGPDYIDPLFHRKVLGVESRNLDSFFETPEGLREVFSRATEGREDGLALIEGVMGYFDGLGGTTASASSFEAARILDCPAVLVVDAKGMSLSLAAVIKGFLEYRPEGFGKEESRIRGVVLNRVSPMIYGRLKETLERELPVRVLGYLPQLDFLRIESRHLGLVLPEEIEDLKEQIGRLADVLEETVDLDGLLEIAESGSAAGGGEREGRALAGSGERPQAGMALGEPCGPDLGTDGGGDPSPVRVGVARDEAFCFYYQENLLALKQAGIQITEFSPLRDGALPEGVCGLLLGGGYPELYAERLEENRPMREAVLAASRSGMPILGECGGFLYLLDALEGDDGRLYEMAGVFSGEGRRGSRLGNFGYAEFTAGEDTPFLPAGGRIRGHEFHYWQASEPGGLFLAKKPQGGKEWPCMRGAGRTLAGFPHLYYRSCPGFAGRFARACRDYREELERGKGQEEQDDT